MTPLPPDTPAAQEPATSPTALRERLDAELGGAARAWLHEALAEAVAVAPAAAAAALTPRRGPAEHATGAPAAEPPRRPLPTWEACFAEAGRCCRTDSTPSNSTPSNSTPLSATPSDPTPHPDPATATRILLLHTARADRPTTHRLYAHGTAAERRAVLLALPHLAHADDGSALPLVEDALRTNDTRLVAAALGPYAADHLPPHAWRHAVLKCLFTGVPVDAVHGLARRTRGDTELARMLTDYAAERTAARRPVPDDLHHVLALTGPAAPSTSTSTSTPAPAPAPEAPSEES